MTDETTAQLLDQAEKWLKEDFHAIEGEPYFYGSIASLIKAIRRQDARIAALEAARAPHGPPLEGTGPLPLERKGG